MGDESRRRENDGTGEEHVCRACDRSFDSEDALARHLRDVGIVD